jgi:hypothetical protein
MAVNFIVPEVNPFPLFLFFTVIVYFWQVYLLSNFSLFLPILLISKL